MWFVKRDSNTGPQVIPTYKQDIKCNVKMKIYKPKQPARTLYSLLLWNLKSARKYQSAGEVQPLEPFFCKSPRPHISTTYIGWNIGSNVFQLLVETSYCFPGNSGDLFGMVKMWSFQRFGTVTPNVRGSKGHGLNWLIISPIGYYRFPNTLGLGDLWTPKTYLPKTTPRKLFGRPHWPTNFTTEVMNQIAEFQTSRADVNLSYEGFCTIYYLVP